MSQFQNPFEWIIQNWTNEWMNGVETRTPTVRNKRFKYMHSSLQFDDYVMYSNNSFAEMRVCLDSMLHQQPLKQLFYYLFIFSSSFFHIPRSVCPPVCPLSPSTVVSCAFISFARLKSRDLFTATDWHVRLL